ncbi:DUF4148 domain-containing protein [Burkholderia vietnamiensis]|uniref:DUF4148 domain-containing protein n=1 Tax=Burkholderia vietnamiensis TaxID=60552 RepID=A0AAW7SZM3_BURVI|nr:DUF4148 domain-containing protein [Burkholderia vietnamiensis]MBH9645831.1 DUF4148 domain-containing protein [Burkholderia vietnamiensis]MBR8010530.1 DUF4148 domain-containing protein [Burkholderia vietnamiensis]MDN7551284.1 DUF4148 domain-containing protein [Burkholderia vietnamiensis]MDN7795098.1 DUF4148 domain-containing protein [Burkholderia vietnamiensis]MDN8043610.1 DUF4148 domain-containing protein [Burkholderia vietnamiensis]
MNSKMILIVGMLSCAMMSAIAETNGAVTRQEVRVDLYKAFLDGRLPQGMRETYPSPPSNQADTVSMRRREAACNDAYARFAR